MTHRRRQTNARTPGTSTMRAFVAKQSCKRSVQLLLLNNVVVVTYGTLVFVGCFGGNC